MRFDARDLKPHAEPLAASDLKKGEVYYAVRYLDDEMLTPVMNTLVFVGADLDPEDPGKLYFQDVEPRKSLAITREASELDDTHYIIEVSDKPWIFRFEQALDLLLKCSLRRRERGIL